MSQTTIILGSGSPRRKEVLDFFDLPYEVIPSNCDESIFDRSMMPDLYVATLAQHKAHSFTQDDRVILTADTIVVHDGKILGKPADEEHALDMLRKLNGSRHTVTTALCGRKGGQITTRITKTVVEFHQLTEEQLIAYHDTFHGKDKAGGYGVQEGGAILVKKIEGCFYNVLGLSITPLVEVLAEFGIDLWKHLKRS